jgi:hypothetical protein
LLGWYLSRGLGEGWRIRLSAVGVLVASVALALVAIYATDHRFNLEAKQSYLTYWQSCILHSTFEQGAGDTLRLIAKFLWGWHGRQPFVTAGIAPLQALGAYSVIRRLKRRDRNREDSHWGSRSAGSLILLAAIMVASAVVYYPICAGRVVLFAQIHTQILAVEGAIFILSVTEKRKAATISLLLFGCVVLFHSAREYVEFIRAEPAENLRPILSLIRPEAAGAIWVHPCSVAQVRALPDGLPIEQVVFGDERPLPPRDQKTWILWSHLGNETCVIQLERVRNHARSWQVIHEGPGRGLALAEF